MTVELRIYKRFDQDLMALKKMGVKLGELVKAALYSFARGEHIFFAVPDDMCVDLEDRRSFHLRVNITDGESIQVLLSVKPSYRNSFCKALLREAFIHQALGVYLTASSYIYRRNGNFRKTPIDYVDCGQYKFINKKTDDKIDTAPLSDKVSQPLEKEVAKDNVSPIGEIRNLSMPNELDSTANNSISEEKRLSEINLEDEFDKLLF